MAVILFSRLALTTLTLLALITPFTPLSSQGSAAFPTTTSDPKVSVSIDIVINKNDTYDVTLVARMESNSSSTKRQMEKSCNDDPGGPFDDAKTSYSERGGHPTCTISGKAKKISGSLIKHKGDEYIFDSGTGGIPSSSSSLSSYRLSVTFPGKITDADGGKVSGTTVTFNEPGDYRVVGKDTPAFPWVWVILGVLVAGTIGGIALWYLYNRRKKAQQQTYQVYAAGGMGYMPGQPTVPGQAPAPDPLTPPVSGAAVPGYPQRGYNGTVDPGPVPPPPSRQSGSPTF